MERFLYRLSKSSYKDRFILKGALMLQAWRSPQSRPTMDIDMLGRTDNDETNLANIVQNILTIPVEDDGLLFFPETIKATRIKEDAEYHGIRILLTGKLDTARIRIQIDVGFDDIIYPEAEILAFPTILDHPNPKLLAYSRESAIAEKFEAIVKLGNLNSRMKDFFDIWLLSRQFDFERIKLTEAIQRTFTHRRTSLEDEILAFSKEFSVEKQVQWNAFRKRLKQKYVPESLQEVIEEIQLFLEPIIINSNEVSPTPSYWKAPGPWK